jgi:valyl-tRNA synthetase
MGSSFSYINLYTSRIETLIADVAVASNERDYRYKLNRKFLNNMFNNLRVEFIRSNFVDIKFGTGLVKITPGHSKFDFRLYLKNNLKIISIIDTKGSLNKKSGLYKNESVYSSRRKIRILLYNLKIIVISKQYNTLISYSEKSNQIIEPLLSKQ